MLRKHLSSIRTACLLVGVVLVSNLEAGETMNKKSDNQKRLDDADEIFNSREYARATDLYKELAEQARQDDDLVVLVQAFAMAARGHLIRGEQDNGLPWIEKARKLANPEEPLGWSRYLGVQGRFESHAGNDEQATMIFKDMYTFCMENDQFARAIDAAHMVALTGTPEEQIEWANKGIQAAEEGDEPHWLGPLWNNLGITYWTMALEAEQQDEPAQAMTYNLEAVECYKKARHYHIEYGSKFNAVVADWALGSAYRRTGEFDRARSLLNPVLDWAAEQYAADNSDENGEWLGLADLELGLIAYHEGQYQLANTRLDNAHKLLGAVNMNEWDLSAWSLLETTLQSAREHVSSGN
jgi:tetratricopeptide (TPR) repeat protein